MIPNTQTIENVVGFNPAVIMQENYAEARYNEDSGEFTPAESLPSVDTIIASNYTVPVAEEPQNDRKARLGIKETVTSKGGYDLTVANFGNDHYRVDVFPGRDDWVGLGVISSFGNYLDRAVSGLKGHVSEKKTNKIRKMALNAIKCANPDYNGNIEDFTVEMKGMSWTVHSSEVLRPEARPYQPSMPQMMREISTYLNLFKQDAPVYTFPTIEPKPVEVAYKIAA